MTSLTLGNETETPAPTTATNIDITPQNFSDEILEASQKQLVITVFWSPKSAASGQLIPLLEKAVAETNAAARLTKVDVSKYQAIAQQIRVQSIPAVYAFWRGQPVDGFMGAIPEKQLSGWLSKLIQTTGAKGPQDSHKGIERALEQAHGLMEEGDMTTAQAIYEDLSAEFPEDPDVLYGCMNCMIKMNKIDEVKELYAKLPPTLADDKKLQPIKAALELSQEASTSSESGDLMATIQAEPDNHEARFEYAMHLYNQNDCEAAIDQLLEIVQRDRTWHDDGARTQILKIFEALGPTHEFTIQGRKKLSTILFS